MASIDVGQQFGGTRDGIRQYPYDGNIVVLLNDTKGFATCIALYFGVQEIELVSRIRPVSRECSVARQPCQRSQLLTRSQGQQDSCL